MVSQSLRPRDEQAQPVRRAGAGLRYQWRTADACHRSYVAAQQGHATRPLLKASGT